MVETWIGMKDVRWVIKMADRLVEWKAVKLVK